MLLERESSALKRVFHLKILIQLEGNTSHSFILFIIFDFSELGDLLFFLDTLDVRFLGEVRERGTDRCHVPTFTAVEAESLLDALLLFFWSEFLWEFDYVNVHGIGVYSSSRRSGEGLESLDGPSTSLGDLFSTILLILEVGGFYIPVIDFI